MAASTRSEDDFVLATLLRAVAPITADAQAAALLAECGSLGRVLAASSERQARAIGVGSETVALIQAARTVMLRALRCRAQQRTTIDGLAALSSYLQLAMGSLPAEQLRILYLDSKNALLSAESCSVGTIDAISVNPREIMRRALEVGATALIIAHNHPSGVAEPSNSDLSATRAIAEAGRVLGIRLHDHLIVTEHGYTSLRARGYL